MVPWVPMITMLYTNAAISRGIEKNLKINRKRSGASKATFTQLKNGSQAFLVLKTFSLEKNSFKICVGVGFTKSPFSFFQP